MEQLEHLDHQLTALADGAAFPVVLLVALLLGLRHASDPDHLAAIAPLATDDPRDRRRAVRLGAAWGTGHAAILLLVGVPLLLFRAEVPQGLGAILERAVGVMIVLLAVLALVRWGQSMREARARAGAVASDTCDPLGGTGARHAAVTDPAGGSAADAPVRRARTAFVVGVVHGLAGTGAVVLLLLSLLPSRGEALAALLVFAPASILSMALVTGGWTWLLARPRFAVVHRIAVVPLISVAALVFGASYAGVL